MKNLNQYIKEKLIVNKNYKLYTYDPKSFDELRKIIDDRYKKLGPGTEQNPIDFNDVDVSNIRSFCNDNKDKGIFDSTRFKYIDISYWNVSSVTDMSFMFYSCELLKSVGDVSGWDVSNVTKLCGMFYGCEFFNQDISGWDVSNVTDMSSMFENCKYFNQNISSWNVSNVTNMNGMFNGCEKFNKDLSNWDVSNVTDMSYMFQNCNSFNQDLSGWDVSKIKHFKYRSFMFRNCPIKDEYKPKFK